MSTKKVKGLLKGLRYISKVFDDEQEEPEMQIGYPTDVKHVAHIGWDGPDDNNNNNKGPTWMNDFKPNADDDSSPRPDGHIGDEAKGTKQEKINRNKMRVAIPPKDAAASSSPAASPSQNGTKKSRNRRHTSNSPAGSPSYTSGRHRSSRRNQGGSGSAQGTDPNVPAAGVPKKVRRRRQPSSEGGSKEKNLSMDRADLELAGAEFGSQG